MTDDTCPGQGPTECQHQELVADVFEHAWDDGRGVVVGADVRCTACGARFLNAREMRAAGVFTRGDAVRRAALDARAAGRASDCDIARAADDDGYDDGYADPEDGVDSLDPPDGMGPLLDAVFGRQDDDAADDDPIQQLGPNGCTCAFNGDCNCRFVP